MPLALPSALGAWARRRLQMIGDLAGLLVLTLRQFSALGNPARRKLCWMLFRRQLFNTGFRATYVNCILALLLGVALADVALNLVPRMDSFADLYVIIVIKEAAPILSGVILIARSATAVTAEIAYLQLHDEFDVLKSQGVNPTFVFVLPVLLAFPTSLLLMFVYFNTVALLSSWIYFVIAYHSPVTLFTWLDLIVQRLGLLDYLVMGLKGWIGGSVIGLLSLYAGWQVNNRFTDVSRAISNSTTSLLLFYFSLCVGLSVGAY